MAKRLTYGNPAARIHLIVPDSIWLVRKSVSGKTAHKFPAEQLIVIRLDRVEGVPLQEWRVVYRYDGRTTTTNGSVASFFTSFRRNDEEMVEAAQMAMVPDRDLEVLNRTVTKLHFRVVQIENFLKALDFKRDMTGEDNT